jgi:hypothetical protein
MVCKNCGKAFCHGELCKLSIKSTKIIESSPPTKAYNEPNLPSNKKDDLISHEILMQNLKVMIDEKFKNQITKILDEFIDDEVNNFILKRRKDIQEIIISLIQHQTLGEENQTMDGFSIEEERQNIRQCRMCKGSKSAKEFYSYEGGKYYKPDCIECTNEKRKEKRRQNIKS